MFFMILPLVITNAAYVEEQIAPSLKTLGPRNTWDLIGGATVSTQHIGSIKGGVGESYDNHTFQWLNIPADSEAIKVVTWSAGSADGWGGLTLRETIEEYEASHPGWVVIGGINGDFFHINDDCRPINYFIQDGDVFKPTGSGALYQGVIGFGDTQKVHVDANYTNIVRSNNPYLKVLEKGATTSRTEVVVVNKAPSATGVNVYTTAFKGNADLTGYKVYVGKYQYNRISEGYIFVKGQITDITSKTTITEVPLGQFYIATKDDSLVNTVEIGDQVKCEYELGGSLAGINNTMGYYHSVLQDGKSKYMGVNSFTSYVDGGWHAMDGGQADGAYIYTERNHTLLGFKEDGSIVLFTTDGRGTAAEYGVGPHLYNCAEFLRYLGCTEGYNLDGGGSTTMIARIDGQLQVMNKPSDGRERSLGNAVLLVMPDPKVELANVTDSTISFTQKENLTNGEFKNVTFSYAGKTFPMEDGKVTLEGLRKGTNYNIVCNYEYVENGVSRKGKVEFNVTTSINRTPTLRLTFKEALDISALIDYRIVDRDEVIEEAYVQLGEKKITIHELTGTLTIDALTPETTYEAVLVVEYDSGSGIKTISSDKLTFTTEKTETPGPVEKTCEEDPTQEKCQIPPVEKTCEENLTQEKCQTKPDPDPTPTPEEPKKGCKKKSAAAIAVMTSLATLALLFIKRKK